MREELAVATALLDHRNARAADRARIEY